ncbi:carboxypeptidase-like regulatory domain-containing protein [Flavobacterium sp.]|uniref:carboxypeptidase-like regulatory domain-containing protein n=1 Tax=Flavobacterium sp. TaxID=239 RepID=UPI0028BD2EAE|nr:carboxypeptidase-like regulatory domain-containing protein [Flavobacterium sp.]
MLPVKKNVIDFTTASDSQINKALQQNEHLCGRFLSTQLNRDLVLQKEKKLFWIATSTAVLSFLSIGNSEVKAQEKPRTEQTDTKVISSENHLESDNQEMTISGVIKDSSGIPLPGISITVKKSFKGVQTDFDGKYIIKAKKGDELEFSFIGMRTQSIIVGNSNSYCLTMIEDGTIEISSGIVVTSYKKRTFLGRTFQKIGNWFR